MGAPRADHRRRAPCPPAARPAQQQARGAAHPDRPGAVRRRSLTPDQRRIAGSTHPRPPHPASQPARGGHRVRPHHRPPGRSAAHRPPRPDAHPRPRPQRAVPARRRRRAHRRAGPGPAPAARQPRVRARPVGLDGRAEQARAREAGRRRGDPPARGRGPVLGRHLRRPARRRHPVDGRVQRRARSRAAAQLRGIESRGSTNLHGGWLTGCEQVAGGLSADGVNRVLLLTDGLAERRDHRPPGAPAARRRAPRPGHHDEHLRRRHRLRRVAAPGHGRCRAAGTSTSSATWRRCATTSRARWGRRWRSSRARSSSSSSSPTGSGSTPCRRSASSRVRAASACSSATWSRARCSRSSSGSRSTSARSAARSGSPSGRATGTAPSPRPTRPARR